MEGPLQYSRGNMSAGMVWAGGMPSKVIFATVVTDAQMGQKKPRDEWQAEERLEKLQQLMTGLYLWSLRVTRADGEDKVVQHQGSLEREHFKGVETIIKWDEDWKVHWLISWEISLKDLLSAATFPFNFFLWINHVDSQIIVCIVWESLDHHLVSMWYLAQQ